MKIKNLFMFIAISAFALTSCNKDDAGNGPNEEEISFYLKIEKGELTKADTEKVPGGEVDFKEGALFFTDGSGNVVRYVRITSDFATGTVTPGDLEDGYLFAGISYTAEAVHIVGNVDFNGKTALNNISELKTGDYVISLYDLVDHNYGVSKATLYGSSPLEIATSANAVAAQANREAKVLLKPLIARFEIEKISAANTNVKDDYVLEGIYIDDFYYKSSVVGTYSDFNDIVYELEKSWKLYSRTTGYSNSEWYPILFDDGGTGAPGLGNANSGAVAPTTTNGAWAYNFYPDASRLPHIILHLSNVKVYDSGISDYVDYPNPEVGINGIAYLTVTGYKSTNGSLSLEGGYIYRIADLSFTENDLRTEPEQPDPDPDKDKLDVWVEVELMDWTIVPTEVEFN